MPKLKQKEVLLFQRGRRNQSTIKRHYLQWRSEQDPPIPLRCDKPNCMFHKTPLIWNGRELGLVLDHTSGVSGDNRPENLRLLCPNCNSQQKTHGGANKGKVEQSEGGFAKIDKDGKQYHILPIETGYYELLGNDVKIHTCDEK